MNSQKQTLVVLKGPPQDQPPVANKPGSRAVGTPYEEIRAALKSEQGAFGMNPVLNSVNPEHKTFTYTETRGTASNTFTGSWRTDSNGTLIIKTQSCEHLKYRDTSGDAVFNSAPEDDEILLPTTPPIIEEPNTNPGTGEPPMMPTNP